MKKREIKDLESSFGGTTNNSEAIKATSPVSSTENHEHKTENHRGKTPEQESAFYTKRKPEKKAWYKTKTFIWGTTLTVVTAAGLGLGLGLYYGLSGTTTNDSIAIPNYGDEDFLPWVEEQVKKSNTKEVENLKNDAVIWMFDQNAELIEGSATKKDNAESSARNEIEQEKDDYRANYGSSWYDEWEKYLISSGYDNEDEYYNSKVAVELEPHVVELYVQDTTETIAYNTVDGDDGSYRTDDDTHYFYSTEVSTTGNVEAVKNGQTSDYSTECGSLNGYDMDVTIDGVVYKANDFDDDGNWDDICYTETNIQKYVQFYFLTQKPFAVSDILLAFTFASALNDGLLAGPMVFTDSTTVKNAFILTRDIWRANDVTSAQSFNILENTSTASVYSMMSPALSQQSLTTAVVMTLVYGTGASDTGVDPSGTVSSTPVLTDFYNFTEVYTVTETQELMWLYNHSIGTVNWDNKTTEAWSGFYSSSSTTASGNTDKSVSDIPYSKSGTLADGSATTNGSTTDWTDTERRDAYNGTMPQDFTLKLTTSDISDLGSELYSNWANFLGGDGDSTNDRWLINAIEVNTTSGYGSLNADAGASNDLMLTTVAADGLHFSKLEQTTSAEMQSGFETEEVTDRFVDNGTSDDIYYWAETSNGSGVWETRSYNSIATNGIAVLGERMLVSDLNKNVDSDYAQLDGSSFLPTYGILNSYETWFTTNFRTIALNEAMQSEQFLVDHGMTSVEYQYVATAGADQGKVTPVYAGENGTIDSVDSNKNGYIDTSEMAGDDTIDPMKATLEEQTYVNNVNTFYNNVYSSHLLAASTTFTTMLNDIEKYDTIYTQLPEDLQVLMWAEYMDDVMFFTHEYSVNQGQTENNYMFRSITEFNNNGGEM